MPTQGERIERIERIAPEAEHAIYDYLTSKDADKYGVDYAVRKERVKTWIKVDMAGQNPQQTVTKRLCYSDLPKLLRIANMTFRDIAAEALYKEFDWGTEQEKRVCNTFMSYDVGAPFLTYVSELMESLLSDFWEFKELENTTPTERFCLLYSRGERNRNKDNKEFFESIGANVVTVVLKKGVAQPKAYCTRIPTSLLIRLAYEFDIPIKFMFNFPNAFPTMVNRLDVDNLMDLFCRLNLNDRNRIEQVLIAEGN